jgi:hypothetical protein
MKTSCLRILLLATALGCGALSPSQTAAQGVPGCLQPPPFLGAGLVGWWPLDELTGATTYADASGSGNTAVVESGGPVGNSGSPSAVAGKVAGAGYFTTATTRGRAPNSASLNFGMGDFAADCWVRPISAGADRWQPIVDKLDVTGGGTVGYALGISNSLVTLLVGDGSSFQTIQSATPISFNAWNFIAVSV